MKKALVEPTGRVAQVEPANPTSDGGIPFPVAEPLRWVDCADDATPSTHHFDGDGVVEIPSPSGLSRNEQIDAQIRALEVASGGYIRGLREKMLGDEERIGLVRALCQNLPDDDPAKYFATALLAALPSFLDTRGMQNVKALDDEIRTLRAQRVPE